jgi:K+-transporting ATPase ATPase C chain
MLKQFIPGMRIMLALTVLTGLLYPGVVTGLCQLLFRHQANGSLIMKDGHVVGSSLIGSKCRRGSGATRTRASRDACSSRRAGANLVN